MTIPKPKIAAYGKYLTSQNKSTTVVREYVRYATRFAEFVNRRKLCELLLKEYRRYIDQQYSTHNSKNACVSYVNSLLKFLGEEELLLPYFETSRAGVGLKTPPLTDDDIAKLLRYADIQDAV